MLLRRDHPGDLPEVLALARALETGNRVVTTGLVLQELLQGFTGPKAHDQLVERFAAFPMLSPVREDHIAAAGLRNHCRKRGVQVGTIDALLAQLCIHHDLTLLTMDEDFRHVAKHSDLRVWAEKA